MWDVPSVLGRDEIPKNLSGHSTAKLNITACLHSPNSVAFPSIYVKRKVRIRTILGFCCANLGSELWRNNPRIAHANIGSTRNHLGSRNQTSAIRGNKTTIDRASEAARPSAETKPQLIAHAKQFDLLRQRSHERSHTQGSDPRFAQQNPRMVRIRTLRLTYIYHL